MKSFFSKIGTLLLCGVAVAMVGCNDLQEDINKAQNDISAVTVTVEDLQSALAALEAEQEKMAADYAKKAEVEAAKAALQQQLATEKAAIETAISAINTALAQTASKQDVTALQTALTALTTELQSKSKAIEDALALKADKTEVQKVATDLATLQGQYEALASVLAGKAEKTQVEAVAADLAKLQKSYDETAAVVATLNTQVAQNTGTIASLTEFASQAMMVLTNHEGSINNMVERLATVEGQVATLMEGYSQSIALLQNLSTAMEANNMTDEDQDTAIKALQDAQALLSEEVREFKAAYADQVAQFNAQILALQNAIAQHTEGIQNIKGELDTKIAELEAALDAYTAKYDSAIAEINQMLANKVDNAIFEATVANLADELAKVAAFKADIDKLLARVQSLVYVPEWEDGKADINYGTINTTAGAAQSSISDLMIVSHLSTLKYKVNADNAADLASDLAKAKDYFLFEVKTVKTRANEEVTPELEIVNVTAEGGYLLFDVHSKNFSKEFFLRNKNMYSAALKLADGNNNVTTEFANLSAVKVNELTPVVEPADELHEIPYDKADTTVVILKGNKLVFYNENGDALTDAQVAKYNLEVKRFLTGPSNIVRQEVSGFQSVFEGEKRVFKVGYNAELKDFVFVLGEELNKDYCGKTYDFNVNYTVNGYTVKGVSTIELTAKQVFFNLPEIVVDWTVAVADELRDGADLYVKNLVRRTPEYVVPENFEGYTLKQIFNTNNEGDRRYVTLNGVELSQAVTTITATMDEANTSLVKLKGAYAFPEHNAENDYNKYVLKVVKKLDDLHATITFTIKLGKKPAPVVINMPAAELALIGEYPYYIGEVDYAGEAYKEFLKFAGYAKEADAKAVFEAAFAEAAAVADAPKNTVTVNGETGTYNHVDYTNGYIRFYSLNKVVEGPQKYVSTINNFWFGIPFTFNVDANINEPSHKLLYSMGDYVVDVDNVKTVYVDAEIEKTTGVYTVNHADLGKYFGVSKDGKNDHNLTVTFEVKTPGAPDPKNYKTVDVFADANEDVDHLVLRKSRAVIRDWTNGGTFDGNKIEIEAILTVNGEFELDRKPLTLYVKDPLAFTVSSPVVEPRYTGVSATVYTNQYVSLKEIFGDKSELVDAKATSASGMLTNSDAFTKYGAAISVQLARVYYVVGDKKVAYETSKYYFHDGRITLYADDAVLQTSIFAEVEYTLTHRLNEKSVEECTKTVVVEFKPSTK